MLCLQAKVLLHHRGVGIGILCGGRGLRCVHGSILRERMGIRRNTKRVISNLFLYWNDNRPFKQSVQQIAVVNRLKIPVSMGKRLFVFRNLRYWNWTV